MRSSSLRALGILGILVFLFVIPMVGAWFLYGNSHTWSSHTINHGNLIQPTLNISQLELRTKTSPIKEGEILPGHWWLLYINPISCEKECQNHLYLMRQLREATGKDMDRIKRAVVSLNDTKDTSVDDLIEKEYAGTYHFYVQASQLKTIPETAGKNLALKQGYLYLVDPHGNMVMGYTLQNTIQEIYQDLTHLLKISQIG